MIEERIKSNLYKVDASPKGIFFLSYTTPIAFTQGHKELVTGKYFSPTTQRHVHYLEKEDFINSPETVSQEEIEKLWDSAKSYHATQGRT